MDPVTYVTVVEPKTYKDKRVADLTVREAKKAIRGVYFSYILWHTADVVLAPYAKLLADKITKRVEKKIEELGEE